MLGDLRIRRIAAILLGHLDGLLEVHARLLQVPAAPAPTAPLVQEPAVVGVGPVLGLGPTERRLAEDPLVLGHGGVGVAALDGHQRNATQRLLVDAGRQRAAQLAKANLSLAHPPGQGLKLLLCLVQPAEATQRLGQHETEAEADL